VAEAAAALGTTSEGVRSRIKRGTLRAVREGGRVLVILDGAPTGLGPAPSGDRAGDRAELVDELRDRVTFLARELERRADEAAELRRIIAALTSRTPEIEAPRETLPQRQTMQDGKEALRASFLPREINYHAAAFLYWIGTWPLVFQNFPPAVFLTFIPMFFGVWLGLRRRGSPYGSWGHSRKS
jgi:hypothetical protein